MVHSNVGCGVGGVFHARWGYHFKEDHEGTEVWTV